MAKRGLKVTKTDIIVIYLLAVLAIVIWAPWKIQGGGHMLAPIWSSPFLYEFDAVRFFSELVVATLIFGVIFLVASGKIGK